MFFVNKKNKNSQNSVLQLIESRRINGKPKQEIVVSLGADFKIPKRLRKEVARVVTEKLKDQKILFVSKQVEAIADKIIRRIQEKGNSSHLKRRDENEDIQEVYIDQINHTYDRIVGPLVIGDSAWKSVDLGSILEDCGFNDKQTKIAEISILNRLISQDCESAIPSWTKVFAVSDLIYPQAEDLPKDAYYRISDKLLDKKTKIEDMLYENVRGLFNLDSSIILYDLTNTYFEGQCNQIHKAKFNKNQKEKRTDCPQIVIALLIDGEGFVIRHKIFDGKMSDAKSLRKILHLIKLDYKNGEMPTLIFDRGVTSKENIELIQSSDFNFKYIIASRNNTENENAEEFVNATYTTIREDKSNKVEVFMKKEKNEHYLLCKSSGRKRKEESMRSLREERMIGELERLERITFTHKEITTPEVDQKIGRIREKYLSVSQYYDIYYKPGEFNYKIGKDASSNKRVLNILKNRKDKFDRNEISYQNLRADIDKFTKKYPRDFAEIEMKLITPILSYRTEEDKLEMKKSLEGNYLLRTNRDDLDEKTFWNIYTMLTKVEHAFRHLKTDLGLRPNYHHLDERVDGHVFISILAYQLLQTIEYTLRQRNCALSWTSVKRIVTSHTYSSITIPTRSGKTIRLRKPGKPEAVHKNIYNKLNIDYENLPVSKMII